jgi:hypothetical protein
MPPKEDHIPFSPFNALGRDEQVSIAIFLRTPCSTPVKPVKLGEGLHEPVFDEETLHVFEGVDSKKNITLFPNRFTLTFEFLTSNNASVQADGRMARCIMLTEQEIRAFIMKKLVDWKTADFACYKNYNQPKTMKRTGDWIVMMETNYVLVSMKSCTDTVSLSASKYAYDNQDDIDLSSSYHNVPGPWTCLKQSTERRIALMMSQYPSLVRGQRDPLVPTIPLEILREIISRIEPDAYDIAEIASRINARIREAAMTGADKEHRRQQRKMARKIRISPLWRFNTSKNPPRVSQKCAYCNKSIVRMPC